MKILRYLHKSHTRYGILEGDLVIVCDGDPFEGLTKLNKTLDLNSVKLLSPVAPPNIICVGLNYKRHADEAKQPYPDNPWLFLKPTTTVIGLGDPIVLPLHNPDRIDYEIELAIVIGKQAKNAPEDKVLDYVLGYTVANDVSNRAAQRSDEQVVRSKSYDTFCPLGPVIATDVDGDNLDLTCRIDGQTMQSSNTSDMIFSCSSLVTYLSQCMTLLPGTVILTGTPEGVGFVRVPPVYLQEGQVVECEIEGIGVLFNPVVRQDG